MTKNGISYPEEAINSKYVNLSEQSLFMNEMINVNLIEW